MGRPKKNKVLQSETKEVIMSEEQPKTLVAVADEMETQLDQIRLELELAKKELQETKDKISKGRTLDESEKKIEDNLAIKRQTNVEHEDKIKKQKAYDSVKVTGRFMNRRNPGQTVKLPYVKYPEDQAVWHTFVEGRTYTIPRGFADQINEYYHTPRFVQKQGDFQPSSTIGENSQIADVDTSNKKYAFVPVGFGDY